MVLDVSLCLLIKKSAHRINGFLSSVYILVLLVWQLPCQRENFDPNIS